MEPGGTKALALNLTLSLTRTLALTLTLTLTPYYTKLYRSSRCGPWGPAALRLNQTLTLTQTLTLNYTLTAAVGVPLGAGRHRLLQHAHKHARTYIGGRVRVRGRGWG